MLAQQQQGGLRWRQQRQQEGQGQQQEHWWIGLGSCCCCWCVRSPPGVEAGGGQQPSPPPLAPSAPGPAFVNQGGFVLVGSTRRSREGEGHGSGVSAAGGQCLPLQQQSAITSSRQSEAAVVSIRTAGTGGARPRDRGETPPLLLFLPPSKSRTEAGRDITPPLQTTAGSDTPCPSPTLYLSFELLACLPTMSIVRARRPAASLTAAAAAASCCRRASSSARSPASSLAGGGAGPC